MVKIKTETHVISHYEKIGVQTDTSSSSLSGVSRIFTKHVNAGIENKTFQDINRRLKGSLTLDSPSTSVRKQR